MDTSRRTFIGKSLTAGAAALMIPELAKAAVSEQKSANAQKITIKQDCIILMQGDSITDAGRDKSSNVANSGPMLGNGYSLFVASQLLTREAAKQPKIYNRGFSGNRVYELRSRWEIDCLAIMPDVLSILIGVNDYWHTLTNGYKGTIETYENDYRALLKHTREKLPKVQLVICEPFAVKGGTAIEDEKWFPMFDSYRKVAKKMADEFKAVFVPFQAGFDAALKLAPAHYWAPDGVHPELPGRQLMANMWLEAVGIK